jgi:hypothetical protein
MDYIYRVKYFSVGCFEFGVENLSAFSLGVECSCCQIPLNERRWPPDQMIKRQTSYLYHKGISFVCADKLLNSAHTTRA